ncbi:MAG TPA: glycosyltransferase family 2 protein [Longimicrobium sp.]|nr:glycosyltransferase family 2 protein [Longimicrobium sp.]
MSGPAFRLTVAVPVYNEEEALPLLLARLGAVLDALPGGPHEMVFVNDGSRDATLELLRAAAGADPRVRAVSLSRNFGHQQAITAALDHATGDAVLVMDADLQDTPESIPEFVDLFRQGYDVVYARRVARKEAAWKRAAYFGFYRLAAHLSTVPLPLDAGDFGLMSRRVVDLLRAMPERHRYLRGMRAWAGFRQIGVAVERAERGAGESKYGLRRLMGLAFDGIFAFSVVPLRAAAAAGVVAMVLSTLFAVYSLVAKLFLGHSPQGFTALILVITFLSGVQLLFLGVIGEYLGRVYEEVKQRPSYVVGEVLGGAARGPAPIPPDPAP